MTDLNNSSYDPQKFCDTLIDRLHLKNDTALADALEVAPPAISKIRNRKIGIGPSILVRAHDLTDLPIREIRKWAYAAPAEK